MGYLDDLKAVRKQLRKDLKGAGVNASVRGQQGTGAFWTDIIPKNNNWSEKEMGILNSDFNIHVGHSKNWGLMPMEKLQASVGGYKNRSFKNKPQYKNFLTDFNKTALKQKDSGTCCGGAGTIIEKNGMAIDFIKQYGQSDSRNAVTERLMKNRANSLGLNLKHESGWMD
jgi:hypothetical protein